MPITRHAIRPSRPRPPAEKNAPDRSIPRWVRLIRAPVWVSGANRRILWMNPRAGRLFDRQPQDCMGRCCYEVIDLRGISGERVCTADCEIQRRAKQGMQQPIHAVRLPVPSKRWFYLLAIPVWPRRAGSPVIVHCAVEEANRTPTRRPAADPMATERLTPREQQVLDQLVLGAGLREIASTLGICYPTIRNHVQHILEKLSVHSVRQAIARVLGGPGS